MDANETIRRTDDPQTHARGQATALLDDGIKQYRRWCRAALREHPYLHVAMRQHVCWDGPVKLSCVVPWCSEHSSVTLYTPGVSADSPLETAYGPVFHYCALHGSAYNYYATLANWSRAP